MWELNSKWIIDISIINYKNFDILGKLSLKLTWVIKTCFATNKMSLSSSLS